MSESQNVLALQDNSNMKGNLKLLLLRNTNIVCCISIPKDAGFLVTVSTLLYNQLKTQILLSLKNIPKLYKLPK